MSKQTHLSKVNQIAETKDQLRKLIKVVQEVVDDRRRDYDIDDEYDESYQNYLKSFNSMELLIEQMQNNLDALDNIHTVRGLFISLFY